MTDRQWRDLVVARDQMCVLRQDRLCRGETRDEYLTAHHILTKGSRPDLRHVVSNGITVCHHCHQWAHAHPEAAEAIARSRIDP